MRTEYKIFLLVTGFLYVATVVYGWWTWYDSPTNTVEWVGTLALLLSGTLTLMCGGYFWFVARRIDLRPEDRDDADISEGAGEIGFFSPGSYWPFGLALSALVAGLGLVYLVWWLLVAGLVAVILTASGLLFEYYTGARRAH
jgi:hypothetical protein